MRIHLPHNPKPRIDLGGTISKNPTDGLVRPAREFAMSVTESSNKVREHKNYDGAIINFVYGNSWWENSDKELYNLDLHQIWTYIILPVGQKAIGYKCVF